MDRPYRTWIIIHKETIPMTIQLTLFGVAASVIAVFAIRSILQRGARLSPVRVPLRTRRKG